MFDSEENIDGIRVRRQIAFPMRRLISFDRNNPWVATISLQYKNADNYLSSEQVEARGKTKEEAIDNLKTNIQWLSVDLEESIINDTNKLEVIKAYLEKNK